MTTITDPVPAAIPYQVAAPTFSEARERHQSAIFAFVSRRIKPVQEAEDVTAQVFADAFTHWSRLRGDPRLWLFGIARRKVADSLRRRKWWTLRETDRTGDSMQDFIHRAETQSVLDCVMRLPANERDALLLQVLEELPIEEIAIVIGRSPAATNSLLQRARNRVRQMVGPMEEPK